MNAMTTKQMNFDIDPVWKILGGAGASIIALGLMLRSYLSNSSVSMAGNRADIGTITRLNKLLNEERIARRLSDERADQFAKERNEAIQAMGDLKGQIQALTFQVSLMQKQLDSYVKTPNPT